MRSDFVAVILTHGRADRVHTIRSLRSCGYSGPIMLLIDDLDDQGDLYRSIEGVEVESFDKREWASRTDTIDNFDQMGAVVFARNAVYDVVKLAGYRYFIMLDDDYTSWQMRFDEDLRWVDSDVKVRSLDDLFSMMVDWLASMPENAKAVCLAQGGDFLGGGSSPSNVFVTAIRARRKAMNTFVCDVERPIEWIGRINEDVNTNAVGSARGELYFTLNQACVLQKATQQNEGGLTGIYLDLGTYVKSFYTVVCHPSGARVSVMSARDPRLHHVIDWSRTTPKIVRESLRKERLA